MLINFNELPLNSGIYLSEKNQINFVSTTATNNSIKISLSSVNEGAAKIFQLQVKNTDYKTINVNSFVVIEFVLPDFPQKILENGWEQCSYTDFRNKFSPSRKKIILPRDQNQNSFLPGYGYLEGSMVSEWFTQLVYNKHAVLIGAVTVKDQFTQVYLRKENNGIRIRVTC